MPAVNIVRQKQINASPEKMHDILSDLGQWAAWSPWLISEPGVQVDVQPGGKAYSWKGSRVGEGNMQVTDSSQPGTIHYDLTFLKPWKSKAKVKMQIQPSEGGSLVSWSMDSKLPFFMFFMKKMMVAFVSSDYDRGLNLLKDYAEDGEIHSKLDFLGRNQYPGCNYVGIKRSCSFDEMPQLMKTDFTALMTESMKVDNCRPLDAICIYHKWDMVKKTMSYTAGIPYDGATPQLASAQMSGSIPATSVYTLEHIGPYEHLGNAWSTLYGMVRSKEIRVKKSIHPFETYGNSPTNTDPHDLSTKIHFPVR